MIGDNYLHVQHWRPNFVVEEVKITTLPVWVRFSKVPLEYYKEEWLKKVGDNIGRTIRVDMTTRVTTRGKFASVCIELEINKPLSSHYRMRGKTWRLQYEGLRDLCLIGGKYGYKEEKCPLQTTKTPSTEDPRMEKVNVNSESQQEQQSSFEPWMVAQHSRWQPP